MPYDIRLKENFKLFISGPSRCGKTFFISNLILNIDSFSKEPPEQIIFIFSVWQWKYDEMRSIVHHFIKDDEDIFIKNPRNFPWKKNTCGIWWLYEFNFLTDYSKIVHRGQSPYGIIPRIPISKIIQKRWILSSNNTKLRLLLYL